MDTPGFDDTHKTYVEILELISRWVQQMWVGPYVYLTGAEKLLRGRKKASLSGILYLHRISDNRMAGTPLRNLRMFEKLCGTQSYSRVLMVTTMWDALRDEQVGERREEELKSTFWVPMIGQGSSTERFRNTEQSAWHILEHFLHAPRERQELRLQRELDGLRRVLPNTATGKELSRAILEFLEKRKSLMGSLQEQMRKPDVNDRILVALQAQFGESEKERQDLLERARALGTPRNLHESSSIPHHLRDLIYNAVHGSFERASKVVEGLKGKDAQSMADCLSAVRL